MIFNLKRLKMFPRLYFNNKCGNTMFNECNFIIQEFIKQFYSRDIT